MEITDCVALIQVHLRKSHLELQDERVQNYLNKLAKSIPNLTSAYPLPWNHYHKLPDIALQELCKRLIEYDKASHVTTT